MNEAHSPVPQAAQVAEPRGDSYLLPGAALAAVAAVALLSLAVGARAASVLLALLLVVAAVTRSVVPDLGRPMVIRARWFDVAVLAGLAVVIAGLALTTTGV